MYFQNLNNIRDLSGTDNINQDLINQFDFWLASRRTAIKDYLCPNSFSRYSGLDPDLSLELFILGTHEKVNLLRPRFDIYIVNKGLKIDSVYNYEDIPDIYVDPEDDKEYKINLDEDVRIYFELLQEISEKPSLIQNDSVKPSGVGLTNYVEKRKKVSVAFLLDESNN